MPTDGRTDTHTDVTKLIGTLREYAKVALEPRLGSSVSWRRFVSVAQCR